MRSRYKVLTVVGGVVVLVARVAHVEAPRRGRCLVGGEVDGGREVEAVAGSG